MTEPDLLVALETVVDAFERLGVPYSIVGSVASSAHGVARSTLDADLVADLRLAHVAPLVAALEATYYVDADVVVDAVKRRAMFNAIHLGTMIKVDVYVLSEREFDRGALARRVLRPLISSGRSFQLGTPEDIVLHKLEWYRAGGEVSDRQWHDIVGVLSVQGDALDREYLDEWARALGVSDLLARARAEVTG